jgi:phosphate transport system substrate-binding protein
MKLHGPNQRRQLLSTAMLYVVGCTLTLGAHAAETINGSGSTFVHPIMLKWAASYNAKTQVQVNYQAIGSGAGIRQIKAGTVTFGASDKPLPPDELQAAGLAQFPLVIGGVVPVVNLDGIKSGQLNFTGELLANIYLGKVTTWNDPAIVALNPDAKLSALKINVAYRSDGSGTTFNWVNYLSKVSPEWKAKVGEGTTVKWPTGSGGNGNEGVSRYVHNIKGSIGYVELAFAVQHKMTFGKVKNKAGAFVIPSPESFQAAASNASWKASDFYEVLTDAEGKDSWPIAATVFILMPRRAPDPAKSDAALQFFRWALKQGQADAQRLDYVPLPEDLVKQVETYWTQGIK